MNTPPVRFDGKWCLAAFALVAVQFSAVLPLTLGFDFFVGHDPGWAMGLDAAWCGGLTPAVDVQYYYGLLAVLVDRGWFATFGRSAAAQGWLIAACVVAIAAGLALVARGLPLSPAGRRFILFSIPVAVMPINFPSPAHAMEAACLSLALGFQAQRRLAVALPFTLLAVLTKPALGYLHGFILVVQILAPDGERNLRRRALRLLPAVATAVVAGGLLLAAFGPTAFGRTLIPFATAARVYEAERFGLFFGVGRRFILPDPVSPGYYLLTPAGYWIVATLLAVGLLPFARRRFGRVDGALAMTAVGLHVVFVCFLFGNEYSWLYYPFYLVAGAAAVLDNLSRSPSAARAGAGRAALVALCILAVSGQTLRSYIGYLSWTNLGFARDFGGTFVAADETAFWREARELAARRRVFVAVRSGGVSQLLPEFDSPRLWYFLRPIAFEGEIAGVRAQLAAADFVVVPNQPPEAAVLTWPEFAGEAAAFQPVRRSRTYTLLARARNPGPPPAKTN